MIDIEVERATIAQNIQIAQEAIAHGRDLAEIAQTLSQAAQIAFELARAEQISYALADTFLPGPKPQATLADLYAVALVDYAKLLMERGQEALAE